MGTTTEHWRWLPTPVGADDRLRLDQPLGADALQTIASNACHAARQNNLGTLWEHPGGDVWETLANADPAPDSLYWHREDSAGVFARYAGAHRIRPYGETSRWPTIELRARFQAPSTYTTGIVLVARRTPGLPSTSDLWGVATTTSTSFAAASISLEMADQWIGRETIACRPAGSASVPEESGELPLVHLYVGAWCASASGAAKGALSGLTIFLKAPP